MKKALILTATLLFLSIDSQAQSIKFGLKAGANYANFTGNEADGFDGLTSYHVGAVLELKVLENFAVQPELLYSSQGAKRDGFDDVKLDYVTVPVLAKFYLISDRLSLEAGPQFSFLVNDNLEQTFKKKDFDFAAVGGLGFNFTENIFAQARYVVGLTDTTKDAEIKNSVIQLSLGYRF